jgi:hypothetical protein
MRRIWAGFMELAKAANHTQHWMSSVRIVTL